MRGVAGSAATAETGASPERLYREVRESFGPALERLAGGYEASPDRCRDLVQDIHAAIWRSLALFDGRCSLRTWVYRVSHNVATSHLVRERRTRFETLEDIEGSEDVEAVVDRSLVLRRLQELIHELAPLDRQLILLYLEGIDAESTAEICGLSTGAVATRVHRIKAVLTRRFHSGGRDE